MYPRCVVPTLWLYEEEVKTKWPPYDDTRQIWKAIMNLESPKDSWLTYSYEKILFQSDDYNEALQKRKDAEMFSDVENAEKMKKTRRDRHKKHLSDFEMNDIVEKNTYVDNETRKETKTPSGKELGNKGILTEIQNKNPEHINEKSIRKRYDAENNQNDYLTSPAKIIKSKSDTVESVSIKKRVDISHTENVVPVQINGDEDKDSQNNENTLGFNAVMDVDIENLPKDSSELPAHVKEELLKIFIIQTVEDLESLDCRLKKKNYFYYVVEYLRRKGGTDERTHVFNILNSTISNSVASQYSYKGQKKKKTFIDLMFNTCIFKAVQSYKTSATEDNIKSAIASWLDNSSSRLKNEQKKCNNAAQHQF